MSLSLRFNCQVFGSGQNSAARFFSDVKEDFSIASGGRFCVLLPEFEGCYQPLWSAAMASTLACLREQVCLQLIG